MKLRTWKWFINFQHSICNFKQNVSSPTKVVYRATTKDLIRKGS